MKATCIIVPSIKAEENEAEKNKDKVSLRVSDMVLLMCIVLAVKWREMQIDISDQRSCMHMCVCVCVGAGETKHGSNEP